MTKKIRNIVLALILVAAISISGFFLYVGSAYEPVPEAMMALQSSPQVTVQETDDYFSFNPTACSKNVGFIFYQGGKVEEEAYAPFMHQLAEQGISSYLIKLPFNLAVFDIDAAQEVMDTEDQINTWYLGGHSLGGVMASSFAEENAEKLNGLIFLASYSATDLTETSLNVLSIYGNQDTVMDTESFSDAMALLPEVDRVVIEGGNHAQFGNYGPQNGDSPATISVDEQQTLTVEHIMRFITETTF